MKKYMAIIGIVAAMLAVFVLLSVSFQRTFQMETAEQFNNQQLLLACAEVESVQTYLGFHSRELLATSQV